jgi:pSer/pThr/pTyr-binding forkhead associated (FHA) protein
MPADVILELMIMSGPDDGKICSLHGKFKHDDRLDLWRCRFTIGRRDSCDVPIPFDTLVSRLHATIQISPEGEVWLLDEDSRNGTFIDREKVTVPFPIAERQIFRVGKTLIRLQSVILNQKA